MLPVDLGVGALMQAHDAEAGDALPGPRFADDAQGGPAVEAVRDPVHRLDQAVVGRELDPQVADLEQGFGHQVLTLGSTTAYRMSTTRLATTMKKRGPAW